MKFSMFFIAEYANIVTIAAMTATLFFGGWDLPFTRWDETPGLAQTLVTGAMFFVKTFFFIFFVMWIRWTLPRFRYDQLMSLGWKFMIPVALVYLMITTVAIWGIDHVAGITAVRAKMAILFGINVALAWLLFWVVDSGRIVSSSYRARTMASAAGAGGEL
jgi:NADH-quinone oxidoreductase subunit H